MAVNTHLSDDGNTRYTVTAGRIWAYFYQEWSASSRREIKISQVVWYNPFSWFTKHYWRTEGQPLSFEIDFLRGDGVLIPHSTLQASLTNNDGFKKVVVYYGSIGFTSGSSRPGTADITELGNDARSVAAIRVKYTFNGQEYEIG